MDSYDIGINFYNYII